VSCTGSLIFHVDRTIAGCSLDESEECAGLEVRHEGDPKRCFEWFGECNVCGIHP
jgi:hypothetical protein